MRMPAAALQPAIERWGCGGGVCVYLLLLHRLLESLTALVLQGSIEERRRHRLRRG